MRPDDPPAPTLTLVAALALDAALSLFAPASRISLKWPNDLMLDGAKAAGILLERTGEVVVIGFGVNLMVHPSETECRAASLAGLGVATPSPGEAAAVLADAFADWLARWRGEGLPVIRAAWLSRAHPEGTPLVANLADGTGLYGRFAGLAEDGALRLRLADGEVRVIHAGDVFAL